MTLSVGFINPNEVLWELQCSTGWLNICELKYATLTDDVTGQGLLLPATNLRMTDGWIPEFDTKMAQLLRPETHTLVILNCYVRLFVIREMLRVLILDGNRVEKIDIFESGSPFEIQFLSAENNQLTDLSFVTRLGKLESLGVNGNKLEVLKMHWFKNLRNLNILNLSSNKIKTIESKQMQSLPIEHLLLEHNLLTEFNTKHWQAHNLSYLSLEHNQLQSINTLQLSRSFPALSSIDYDDNPWNCGRLESLQFNLKTNMVKNYSQSLVQCKDNESVHTISLKMPELIDKSEEKLNNLERTVGQLIEVHAESRKISAIQRKFSKTQILLSQIGEGVSKLQKKYDLLRASVDWFDFYDKLNY